MINDVRRAYFYAAATRDLFINLPPEDTKATEGQVGRLNLSLYGTRDAATNWQETLSKHLVENGFKRGIGHPCVFHHASRNLWTMVHGDDYVTAGRKVDLAWLEDILGKQYELKTQHIGPCESGWSEGKVLNRIVRWQPGGWQFEAAPRHCELLIEQLRLQGAKGLSTPGADNDDNDTDDDRVALTGPDITLFRGLAARCNYLSLDGPDIQYSAKEVCREMSSPVKGSLARLHHLVRYLISNPRLVWDYPYQEWPETMSVFVDSTWASCRRTRKSTSGGAAVWGRHTIKTWAKTQCLIAKSSGEA